MRDDGRRSALRALLDERVDGTPLWTRALGGIGLVTAAALVAVGVGVAMSVVVAWLF